MRAVIAWLQRWDRVAAQRPDVMIPISRVVQERAQQYYGRQTEPPLYPPVSLAAQATAPANESKLPQKFFFTWGRHVAYKQFDTVIRAVAAVRGSLIIAGEGPQTAALQSLAEQVFGAADNIFVGKITDEELRWYLEHAEATVFPQEEDFGIVMLESVLAGCPVIANEKSGATELLTSKDAVFLPDSSVESVVSALHEIGNNSWERLDIQRRARQYAGVRFSQEWKRQLEGHWEKHTQALQTGVKGNYE
ncbi:glycosyltransferase [Candidatus Woesebacteria bacterium]|nr:glycosyltransferase [Candidatus Woesebacteria bacterium]